MASTPGGRRGGKRRAGPATRRGEVRRAREAAMRERAATTGDASSPSPSAHPGAEPPPKTALKGRSLAASEAERAAASADDASPADARDAAPRSGAGTRPAAGRQDASPWWKDGLRFECTACGRCCSNHGEFSYVFSTRAERKAIAAHLGLSLRAFESEYTERVEGVGSRSFVSRGDACVFLDEHRRCAIYALRPKQCRTFPFWPELVADEDSWERDVASFCPGADQGTLHDADTIRERLAEWEP
ncbi:MAG: YkgJ family cysteine cluster protein [Planctomycetes bacterium]|nr:YkgJ family cysteine cluster protein [Planctomycetota bacterium]